MTSIFSIMIYLHKLNYYTLVKPRNSTPENICHQHYKNANIDTILAEVNGELWDMEKPLQNFCFIRFIEKGFGISNEEEWCNAQKYLLDATSSEAKQRIIMISVIGGSNKIFYEVAGTISTIQVMKNFCSHHDVSEMAYRFKVNGEDVNPKRRLWNHSIIEFFKLNSKEEEEAKKRPATEIIVALININYEVKFKSFLTPGTFFMKHYGPDLSIGSFITLVNGKIWNPHKQLQKDSHLYFINSLKNIVYTDCSHSISYSDEEIKKSWYNFMMVQHSLDCRLIKEKKCSLPLCKMFCTIIDHVFDCPNLIECSTLNCTKVRWALNHKLICIEEACFICDAIDHAANYQPHPMSPFCFKNENNSHLAFNHLPRYCISPKTSPDEAMKTLLSLRSNISDPSFGINQPSDSAGDTQESDYVTSRETGYESTLSTPSDQESFAELRFKQYDLCRASSSTKDSETSDSSSSKQYCGTSVSLKGGSIKQASSSSINRRHEEIFCAPSNINYQTSAAGIDAHYKPSNPINPIMGMTNVPSYQSLAMHNYSQRASGVTMQGQQVAFLVNPVLPIICVYPEIMTWLTCGYTSKNPQPDNISPATFSQATANIGVHEVAASDNQISGSKGLMPEPDFSSRDPTSSDFQVEVEQHFPGGRHSAAAMASAEGFSSQKDEEKKKREMVQPENTVSKDKMSPFKKGKYTQN